MICTECKYCKHTPYEFWCLHHQAAHVNPINGYESHDECADHNGRGQCKVGELWPPRKPTEPTQNQITVNTLNSIFKKPMTKSEPWYVTFGNAINNFLKKNGM